MSDRVNAHPSDDDILFDRLVDGELTADEQRALLASLDGRPDGWRRCALAFLEAQTWKAELTALAAKPAQSPTPEKKFALAGPRPRIRLRAAAWWLATAASLLVAFKLGTLDRQHPSGRSDPAHASQPLATTPSAGPAKETANVSASGDALNLWVRNDSGQMQRVRVPLVDASALNDQYGLEFQTGVPEEFRSRLQDHGFTVESKRQYAPMWLDNGRQMIVPVEDTRIVPVSNKVY